MDVLTQAQLALIGIRLLNEAAETAREARGTTRLKHVLADAQSSAGGVRDRPRHSRAESPQTARASLNKSQVQASSAQLLVPGRTFPKRTALIW